MVEQQAYGEVKYPNDFLKVPRHFSTHMIGLFYPWVIQEISRPAELLILQHVRALEIKYKKL